jgi:hypothetical protein
MIALGCGVGDWLNCLKEALLGFIGTAIES